MGSLIGHVVPGIAFVALGLWHLFNHIKLYSSQPNSYTSLPWFPTSRLRYLELIFIIIGSFISISMELFIGPTKHQPFDPDGTIPSNHLRNFEHSSISILFLVYASFAIILDRTKAKARYELTFFIGATAFAQQLFLFHLHSTDHHGLEGQYHFLLQIIVFVSLITTLFGMGFTNSFMVSFVRSVSIFSQGFWFVVMGIMLWTPSLIPKGCLIYDQDGHKIVKCSSNEALNRAKSLVNILFSWSVIGIMIFTVSFYLSLVGIYRKRLEYSCSPNEAEENGDVQFNKEINVGELENIIG